MKNRIIYPNKKPNNDIYPNDNRIEYPNNIYQNKRPNGNGIFGQNSGNSFGPHSGSDIKFGPDSDEVFGQNSGSSIVFGPNSGNKNIFGQHSGKIFGHNSGSLFLFSGFVDFKFLII
jgi:hypothetical protein